MNNNSFNHPFKTFEEQIKILENRGLIIEDFDFAIEALKSFSYYTLVNGYKDLFLDETKPGEAFKTGTKFSMLYQIHWIDLTMSNILFKYTLAVEKKLKTQISNLVAQNFTIEESRYTSENNYSPSKAQRGKYRDVIKAIDEAKSRDVSCIHYMKKEGNLPPWIAAKGMSFGSAVNWYSILRPPHKQVVIKSFLSNSYPLSQDETLDFYKRVIEQVYQYRNLSAHGNRTFLFTLPEKQKLLWSHLKKLQLDEFFEGHGVDNIYSIMMCILILINDEYVAENFLIELNNFFATYSDPRFIFLDKTVYDIFGLNKDFLYALNNFYNQKFK